LCLLITLKNLSLNYTYAHTLIIEVFVHPIKKKKLEMITCTFLDLYFTSSSFSSRSYNIDDADVVVGRSSISASL